MYKRNIFYNIIQKVFAQKSKSLLVFLFLGLTTNLFLDCVSAQSMNYNLIPWPSSISSHSGELNIEQSFTILVDSKASTERVSIATTRFLRRLSGRTGVFFDYGFAFYNQSKKNPKPTLYIQYNTSKILSLGDDESYRLQVNQNQIKLTASTDLGIIRGLETLLQLVTFNASKFYFPCVNIEDKPKFNWRGLMIDVSRHFQPLHIIKRNIDAMTAFKMNVFHWHLSDDQGYRIESKVFPKLHQEASDGQYYTHQQIKEIIDYANKRGIRVVPEIDVPGHATAILTAYPHLGSRDTTYSLERYAGIFNPTLDPTKEETYTFLAQLFKEVSDLFPDQYFHIGGDENNGKDWNENPKIQAFKRKHNFKTNHELQTYFNIKLQKKLATYGKYLMGWDEIMTEQMPTSAIIHAWRGKGHDGLLEDALITAAKRGYQTVFSKGYYIDLMKSIVSHYEYMPFDKGIQLSTENRKNIIGAEATMWSELVTPLTIDSRIWPRTIAIAERMWSADSVNDVNSMLRRVKKMDQSLEELGIAHIKNRRVILRNLTQHQDISSLITLMNVCEPLKIYTRNKGGTEYKSFSPFTLFADACSTDAKDALPFNNLVSSYIKTKKATDKNQLIAYFELWIKGNNNFKMLKMNPHLATLAPLYNALGRASTLFLEQLNTSELTPQKQQELERNLQILNQKHVDVELVIYDALKKLSKL